MPSAEVDGDRLSDEEIIANIIVTMVGGQETTTNLIGNGMLTLLRNPTEFHRLRENPSLIPSAVEELLRYESPSQHTARLAPEDVMLGGKRIRERQAVIAVMAAGNRDPERFPDPDTLDRRKGRQPSPRLRLGRPLLLRCAAGPPRRPNRLRSPPPPHAHPDLETKATKMAPQPRPQRPGSSGS